MANPTKNITFGIVGGSTTTIDKVPYQCQLFKGSSFYCGAVVLTSSIVLTAAHCMSTNSPTLYSVICGSNTLGSGTMISVASGIKHPSYSSTSNQYDVYILKLSSSFPNFPNANIRAVSLPTANYMFSDGTSMTISGFGSTAEGGGSSTTLRSATVPFVNWLLCKIYYFGVGTVTDANVCAGNYFFGGTDTCQGMVSSPK